MDVGEEKFSEFSLAERAKIERETFNKVNGRDKSDKREGESGPSDLGRPTVAVVTFILALEERDFSEVKDTKSLKAALMGLGSDVVSNDR